MLDRLVQSRGLRAGMLVGAWALGALLACNGGEDEAGDCVDGASGCACLEGNVCDPGLSCEAGVCVAASGETGAETSGDGDGDPTTGDGDGDPTTTGDGDGDEQPTDCHPLMVDCPVVGQTCTWDGQQFLCLPGITKLGDSCVLDNPQCLSGFCAPMAMVPGCPSTHCCAAFCSLDTPNCTIEGTACVEYFPDGATTPEVGACLSP